MRRAIFIGLMVLLMVFTAACGSGNPEPDLSSPQGGQDPAGSEGDNPQESMTAELPPINQVDQVAAVLYQGISDGENVVSFVEEIYQALGIPVLNPETEMELIEEAIENQTPFTLESHLELIADALASGVHITLESFVAEMNRDGFYALDSGGEVTLEYLSQNLAYLLEQSQYAPEENQIALVLALGRTRSGLLYGENPDPVWGDDLLDPLQSSLLWHLLDQVAAAPKASTSQTIQRVSHSSSPGNPPVPSSLFRLLSETHPPEADSGSSPGSEVGPGAGRDGCPHRQGSPHSFQSLHGLPRGSEPASHLRSKTAGGVGAGEDQSTGRRSRRGPG